MGELKGLLVVVSVILCFFILVIHLLASVLKTYPPAPTEYCAVWFNSDSSSTVIYLPNDRLVRQTHIMMGKEPTIVNCNEI